MSTQYRGNRVSLWYYSRNDQHGRTTADLIFAYSPMSQNELRGTSITFFLLSGALTLGTYFLGGVSLDVAASESRYLVPAMILGILAGQWLYRAYHQLYSGDS